jgi:hypothetical protein
MIKELPGFTGYTIDINGRIVNAKTNHELVLRIGTTGYYSTVIRGKTAKLHRMLALAFIPNTGNKKTVNHIDGNKLNNNLSNLEWATSSENNKHAYDTKLKTTHKSYSKEDEETILNMNNAGYRNLDISNILSIPKSIVQKIVAKNNKTLSKFRHSLDERKNLKSIIMNSNENNRTLSKQIGLSAELIGKIKKNISWNDI